MKKVYILIDIGENSATGEGASNEILGVYATGKLAREARKSAFKERGYDKQGYRMADEFSIESYEVEGTEGVFYVCPEEDCDFVTYWDAEDFADKGEPVCPNDDNDLVQGCDICMLPQDDDGRCGCTNEDAYGINGVAPKKK